MKKFFLLLSAAVLTMTAMAAPVHVISNQKVAKGYYPRLNAQATELQYLTGESQQYVADKPVDIYVSNEDLKLVLYKNGTRTELYPHGTDVNYIWSSISPDGTKILFNTRKGTAVCDLNGKELVNLGNYNAPVWYGNDYVVATLEENDGHNYTGGAVVILSVDGQLKQQLTDMTEIAMTTSASYETGQIAYDDLDGNIRLMQISLAGKAIKKQAMPILRQVEGVQPKPIRRIKNATKADFQDFKIYINPGHGGYGGDDRGVNVWMNETTQDYGFWESQSNLDKGMRLDTLLRNLGFQTKMSRILNREEDDRDLAAIVKEANEYGADFMLSIHSNAGGPSNYVLQLFRGLTPGDERTYSDMPTAEHNQISFDITTLMGNLQMSNKIATWSRTTPVIAGDKTFAADVMGWSNGYGVLRRLHVPGTISEGAMHDYIPETYRLMNMDYKRQEAWYFLKTFCTYYMDYKQTTGVIGGQVRDAYRKQIFPPIQRIRGSRDELNPINRATVELLQNGEVINTYVTDTVFNGVFLFWDLTPGKYTVRMKEVADDLFYAKETEVEVVANEITHVDMMIDAIRASRPEVVSHSPNVALTDSLNVSTEIVLNFNWDMHTELTEAAFSISPAVEGTIKWENANRTMRFVPAHRFEIGTEYTVTLAKTACHPDTNYINTLADDYTFKFRTKLRGDITILDTYPLANQEDVPLNPSFIVLTDQPLAANANNYKFKVVDTNGKEQTFNARSVKWNKKFIAPNGSVNFDLSAALAPNTDYKLVVESDWVDNIGIYLNQEVEIPFRTAGEITTEGDVVDKFDAKVFVYNAEESQYVESATTARYTSKKMFGTASNQLKFEFTDPESYATYKYTGENLVTATSDSKFGMYVYGEFSKNELIAIWNAEGDVKYTSLGVIDYAGWKYLTADMTELPEGPTFQFMGLRLKRGDGLLSSEGSFCVDDMKLLVPKVSTAIDNVELDNLEVQKVVENEQVIIIKDGVRYNVLGTVVE